MAKKKTEIAKKKEAGISKMPDIPINVLENSDDLSLLKCPSCGGVHFRHAGYVVILMPYLEPTKEKEVKVSEDDRRVLLCVNCKTSYIFHKSALHDISKFINVDAWEKTEKEAQKATGPGGQC